MILEVRNNKKLAGVAGFFFIVLFFARCDQSDPYVSLSGKTMGTTYTIKCQTSVKPLVLQFKVDSLLKEINQSVSTYIPESIISKVNKSTVAEISEIELDQTFIDNFKLSKKLYGKSGGAFNPALAPLINYWGFGYENLTKENVDTNLVKQLKALCNFDDFQLQNNRLSKKNDQQQLNFSAVAKGYGVDKISELLLIQGINNFMVEIGGEVRAIGVNDKNQLWSIAIDKPERNINNRSFNAILKLDSQSVATSGNYRNYRKIGEVEYGHIINPFTGFPQQTDIISATVITKTCAKADAYATACMVLGFDNAKVLLGENEDLKAYIIYKDQSHNKIGAFKTSGLLIQELN